MSNKGKISISKVISNKEPYKYISIKIEDDNGVGIVSCELPINAYGELISGTSHVDCDYEIRNTDKIGKIREVKMELVIYPSGVYDKDHIYNVYVSPYETDGWKAYKGDIGNGHKITYDHDKNVKINNIVFTRFV